MKERNISRDWERSRHLNLQWQELKCRRPHGRQTLAWAFGAPGCRWKRMSDHAAQGLRLDGLSIIKCKMEVIYLRSGSRGPEGICMLPEQVTQALVTPSSVTLLPLPQFTPMASCMWGAPLTSYGEGTAWPWFTEDCLAMLVQVENGMLLHLQPSPGYLKAVGKREIPLMNRLRWCTSSFIQCGKRSNQR